MHNAKILKLPPAVKNNSTSEFIWGEKKRKCRTESSDQHTRIGHFKILRCAQFLQYLNTKRAKCSYQYLIYQSHVHAENHDQRNTIALRCPWLSLALHTNESSNTMILLRRLRSTTTLEWMLYYRECSPRQLQRFACTYVNCNKIESWKNSRTTKVLVFIIKLGVNNHA